MIQPRLAGRLLVATPILRDSVFDRTVFLVLDHDDKGAAGVVLNRPTDTEVGRPLPQWGELVAHPPVVFVGGPVAQGGVIGLARVGLDEPAQGWRRVLDHVGTLDLATQLEGVGEGIEEIRLFSSYAGWQGGQLEAEIGAGAWFVVDADPGDALSPAPESLWRAVLRRQRGRLALFADFPPDPSEN
ncbi:MAG: YqgE/AlgH family protein [Actinomycetota bacterium]|nr:YqgE/AlgH family protein [Actinomycetota bacterium]